MVTWVTTPQHESSNLSIDKTETREVVKLANGMLDAKPRRAQLKLAQRNQKTSPLLRLPPELRTKIWEYYFGSKMIVLHSEGPGNFSCRSDIYSHDSKSPMPDNKSKASKTTQYTHTFALLRVCRQIYAETCILPFTLNTFYFIDVQALYAWNFKMAAQMAMITRVYMTIMYGRLHWVGNEWLDGLQWLSGLKTVVVKVYMPRGFEDRLVWRKFTDEERAEVCQSLDCIKRKINEATTVEIEVVLYDTVLA